MDWAGPKGQRWGSKEEGQVTMVMGLKPVAGLTASEQEGSLLLSGPALHQAARVPGVAVCSNEKTS